MTKREDTPIDPQKLLNPSAINLTLLFASLYLSAFEVLKSSIISTCADCFVILGPMSEEEEQRCINALGAKGEEIVKSRRNSFHEQTAEYKQEVGIDYDKRELVGFIPSCQWLEKIGVFTTEDIETAKQIRIHRNEIAHELPTLIIAKGDSIKIELFTKIRDLLQKVGVFSARMSGDIPDHIPDKDIFSGSLIALDMIFEAVRSFILETPTEQDDVKK